MIKTEVALWREVLLDLGDATLPYEWLQMKINRIFPTRTQKLSAKEPLSTILVHTICTKLMNTIETGDKIAKVLALRDIIVLALGYFHLL